METIAGLGPVEEHETVVVDAELIGGRSEEIEPERYRHVGRAVVVKIERSA